MPNAFDLEFLEVVFQSNCIGIAILDTDLRYVRVNRFLADINGLSPEAHVGKHLREVIPDLSDAAIERYSRVATTGMPVVDRSLTGQVRSSPGIERTWTVSTAPLFGEDRRRITGFATLIHEVTDHATIEAARSQAAQEVGRREQLETLAEMRDRFLAMLSHDLRAPLGVLTMSVPLLERSARDAATVARIERAVASLARLIDNFFQLARRGLSLFLPVDRRPCDLFERVRLAIDDARVAHRGLIVRDEYTGDGAGEWDVELIAQLISNLLHNAATHGLPGVPVTVRLASRGDHVTLEVHNLGPPIPAERIPHVFTPYSHLGHRSLTSVGLGLGLHICEQIAIAHGGAITCSSSWDEGTTFTVTLLGHAVPRVDGAATSPAT